MIDSLLLWEFDLHGPFKNCILSNHLNFYLYSSLKQSGLDNNKSYLGNWIYNSWTLKLLKLGPTNEIKKVMLPCEHKVLLHQGWLWSLPNRLFQLLRKPKIENRKENSQMELKFVIDIFVGVLKVSNKTLEINFAFLQFTKTKMLYFRN